jgi:amino acid transporter
LIKIGVLALFVAFGLGAVDLGEFQPMFPGELTPVSLLPAMGLTFIAFEGYDLITTVTEEIENPGRNVPLAIAASLGATVVVYLLVVFVAIGTLGADRLGASGETAIAEAAGQFMPNMPLIGEAAAVIAFGAVFSTISALNAVVLASSRVAFAMGRDDLLWSRFGQLHPRFGTPVAALLASGAVMVTVAFVPSVQSVGNLTSLFFLLSFVLVNAAVVELRWERPNQSRPFEIPGFPIPPMLAIVCNVVLGFFIEPTTWLLGLGWLAVGGLVYRGRSGGDEADSNAQEET